jgi:group I intron endonuclease
MFTYKVTNTSNGKFYIGSSVDFEARKRSHLRSKDKYPFQNALRQNPEVFEWEVWEDDSSEPVLEQALLDMWFGKEQCYNLNPNASVPPNLTGHKFSKETLRKRSETRRGNNYGVVGENHPFHGRSHSEEAKASNREKHLKKFWVNNGAKEEHLHEGSPIPEGYLLGRLSTNVPAKLPWWVNAQNQNKRSLTSPGPEWKRGRKWH